MYKKEYFDRIMFDANEYGGDYVAVHVHKRNRTCRILRVHIDDLKAPDMWERLHEEAERKWDKSDKEKTGFCHHCGQALRLWERLNMGRHFCGYCGERLND